MRNYKFWGVRKYSVTCLKEDIISISNSYQFLWHGQCWWLWQVWQHTCVKNLIRFWHSFLSTVCHTCAKTSIDIYGNGVPFMLENELKWNWYFWIFSKFACLLDLEIHSLSDLILCLILSWFSFWSHFSAWSWVDFLSDLISLLALKLILFDFISLLDLERKCDEMKWRYKCISL